MIVEQQIPLLEDILNDWTVIIGDEYQGYRNHVYRMVHFCFALHECNDQEKEKIIIAAAFHDIGIWIEGTLDYLPPSVPPAMDYLRNRNLDDWSTEIELMITEHHKVKEYEDSKYPLVEVFRKGDLVDFSLGVVKFGLPRSLIKQLKAEFPNAGFHKNLAKRAAKWFVKHPLNPAPMMKW